MLFCGISIIEANTVISQLSLFIGLVVSFMLAFSTITEIKEQQ